MNPLPDALHQYETVDANLVVHLRESDCILCWQRLKPGSVEARTMCCGMDRFSPNVHAECLENARQYEETTCPDCNNNLFMVAKKTVAQVQEPIVQVQKSTKLSKETKFVQELPLDIFPKEVRTAMERTNHCYLSTKSVIYNESLYSNCYGMDGCDAKRADVPTGYWSLPDGRTAYMYNSGTNSILKIRNLNNQVSADFFIWTMYLPMEPQLAELSGGELLLWAGESSFKIISNSPPSRSLKYNAYHTISAVTVCQDFMVTGMQDGTVNVVKISQECRNRIITYNATHIFSDSLKSQVTCLQDMEKGFFVSGHADGTVGIWSVSQCIIGACYPFSAVVKGFCKADDFLLMFDQKGNVAKSAIRSSIDISPISYKPIVSEGKFAFNGYPVSHAAKTSDGRIATVTGDGIVCLWDRACSDIQVVLRWTTKYLKDLDPLNIIATPDGHIVVAFKTLGSMSWNVGNEPAAAKVAEDEEKR